MHPLLNIAIRAARKAGDLIARSYQLTDRIEVTAKGTNDFVTQIDKQAERLIIDIIHKAYPEHSIIGEESGLFVGKQDDTQWIVDPLDGTANFIKQFPHFSVSIAVKIKGHTEIGVVYDPIRNELFTATRGKGAQLNGYRLRVTSPKTLSGTTLATGFPFKTKQHAASYLHLLSKFFEQCTDFRRTGSAALDLAYVAAGRVDGFFEIGLKPWDFAAGELLIREAGGLITDFAGNHNYLASGNLVAGNPRLVQSMLSVMHNELSDSLKQ